MRSQTKGSGLTDCREVKTKHVDGDEQCVTLRSDGGQAGVCWPGVAGFVDQDARLEEQSRQDPKGGRKPTPLRSPWAISLSRR